MSGRRGLGFSLIELLVVLSVIALLVSVLLPALAAARSSARAVNCGSNLRQIGIASELYASAFREVVVPVYYDYERLWNDVLFDGPVALSNAGLMPDPLKRQNSVYREGRLGLHQCPENPYRTDLWRDTSYAANMALTAWSSDPTHNAGSLGTPGPRWIRAGQLAAPSRVVQLADAAVAGASGGPDTVRPPYWLDPFDAVGFDWHRDRAGLLLLDGHADAFSQSAYTDAYNSKSILWRRQQIYWW